MKKIVIIGAGYAGILTAKQLVKKFKKYNNIDITIIDKNSYHTMLTELHEVAAGRVSEQSIRLDLKKIFAERNINVALDTIKNVDFQKKIVIGEQARYDYDFLVLAAGSKPAFFGVSGAEQHAFKLGSYDDAVNLKAQIEHCFHQASNEPNEALRRALLAFYVVGAGFTGIEMVGELAEYIPILCQRYQVKSEEVTLVNLDLLEKAMPTLPEKLSNKVVKRLQKMGVSLKYGYKVDAITADTISYQSGTQHYCEQTKTVIWTTGIEASELTATLAEKLPSDKRGRIEVSDYLNTETHPEIYVIGDNMMFIDQKTAAPVPQTVENCEQSSAIAAHNLLVDLTQSGQKKSYQPNFHGVMVSVGSRYGVAHVGSNKRFFAPPAFLAMFIKHFISIKYYFHVLGWNKVFHHLRHQFFTVRHNRSFVGGHFSNKTPSFLLVLLRLWLGAVWLFEGVMKIVDGWLQQPKIVTFFGGAANWFNSIINLSQNGATATANGSTAQLAADAVSSASVKAAAMSGTVIFNFDFIGLIRLSFVCGKKLEQATLADYAFKLDIPLMNWLIDRVILSSDNMQMFMQTGIVILEILIGLALIGGLCVTIAAGSSLLLQVMFVCTTGLFLSTFWMIFAAIAVLIGGGRVFGLDYYAMPRLARAWANIPLVKKWYIYHD